MIILLHRYIICELSCDKTYILCVIDDYVYVSQLTYFDVWGVLLDCSGGDYW